MWKWDLCEGKGNEESCFLCEGDRVTLTLDLRPDQASRGTLSMEINQMYDRPCPDSNAKDVFKKPVVLFTDLLDHLDENPGAGFRPVVSGLLGMDCSVSIEKMSATDE